MLYKYSYITNHAVHDLNRYLNLFFNQIENVKRNEKFLVGKYLDTNFPGKRNKDLIEKFAKFFNSYKVLNNADRDKFNTLVKRSDFIEVFYEDINLCCKDYQSDNLRNLLGNDSLKNLMIYLYTNVFGSNRKNLLDHYLKIFDLMPQKICPFCGLEKMHRMYKEDYDHLAPKALYPLFALNLKNMAPMCHICNSKFKTQIDIFYKNNIRRPFAYPYTTTIDIDLDFTGSIIDQADSSNFLGIWNIKIFPVNLLTATWVDVFNIKERYEKDYLEVDFNDWMDEFIDSLIRDNVRIEEIKDLVAQFSIMAESLYRIRLNNCNIIKAPLFKFLACGELNEFYESVLKKIKKSIAA